MLLIVAFGGWSLLVGAKIPILVFAVIYAGFAYFIWEWRRGMLPVIAALAVIMAIFALVAGPDWFARDKAGYNDPTLPSALLGIVTLGLIPVQMLLVVVSMWGFNQKWNVEEEIHPDEPDWPADRPKPTEYQQLPPQAPPTAAPAS
ncbi:MAG: hypothetical protein JHC98_10205 [Thermoleophilaceae bacterium]|nr:hypothetical protein [Thermoleophilaceae bacterium]